MNQQSSSSRNYDDKDRSFSKTSDEPCVHSLRFKQLRLDDDKDSDKDVSESQRRRKEEDDTDVAVSDDKDSDKDSDKDLSSSDGKLVKRRIFKSQQRRKEEDVVVSDELSWDKDSDQRSAFPNEEDHLVVCVLHEFLVARAVFELSLGTETTQSPAQPQTHTPSKCCSHKCNFCEKEFSSYQALGGHKSRSHRDKTQGKMSFSGKKHECCTCHRTFDTSRGLGAHKRLTHNEGNQKETVVARDNSSPSEEEKLKESQGKDKVVREGDKLSLGSNGNALTNVLDQEHSVRRLLDLNEPPLSETDEATEGGDKLVK